MQQMTDNGLRMTDDGLRMTDCGLCYPDVRATSIMVYNSVHPKAP